MSRRSRLACRFPQRLWRHTGTLHGMRLTFSCPHLSAEAVGWTTLPFSGALKRLPALYVDRIEAVVLHDS